MVAVDVFTLGYNEEKMLPHFIKHYKQFCRNITFYNNCSTDSSVDICNVNGVKVINTNINELNDIKNIEIKNYCYHESDADFVIVVDTDEFVYHPDILNLLELYKKQNITLPKVRGYTMASNDGYPKEGLLTEKIKTGKADLNYAKRCILNPKLKVFWGAGQHKTSKIIGKLKESDQEDICILHYKFICREEIQMKKKSYSERMSYMNKTLLLGSHYNNYNYDDTEKWFDDNLVDLVKVI
jgi:hypothetical protein